MELGPLCGREPTSVVGAKLASKVAMSDLTCRLMIVLQSDLEGHLERTTLATWTMEPNKGYGEQEMPPEFWAAQCAVEELRQEL